MTEFRTVPALGEDQIKVIKLIVEEYLAPGARRAALQEVKKFLQEHAGAFQDVDILREQVKYLKGEIDKIRAGQEALGLVLMGETKDE